MCKVQTCPSIFIGRESDHWLPLSITDSLLLSKLDLCVCEDAYSKLVGVVTVADVSDEDSVGISLLQI